MRSRIEDGRWVTAPGKQFQVPAVIYIDADDAEDAAKKAADLSTTMKSGSGPGAFFYGIGVEPTGSPEEVKA